MSTLKAGTKATIKDNCFTGDMARHNSCAIVVDKDKNGNAVVGVTPGVFGWKTKEGSRLYLNEDQVILD